MSVKSYKNGYIEGVVFCFCQDGEVLLEDRGMGFNKEAFFPSGSIEIKDKNHGNDYIGNALFREVAEEFNNQITICEKVFLGEVLVPDINVLFYVFNITKWEGIFPDVIKENDEMDSKISFFSVAEAKKLFKYESAFEILDLVLRYI